MLKGAFDRAAGLGFQVDLRQGAAERLAFADASFDRVAITLALYSTLDDAAAVREALCVLKPGGRLLLLEHVGSPNRILYAVQWLLELVTRPLEGDNLTREPLRHLEAAGFEVEQLERSRLGIVERVAARKPA